MSNYSTSALYRLLGNLTVLAVLFFLGYLFTVMFASAAEREANFERQILEPYWEAEQEAQAEIQRQKDREEYLIQERIEAYKNSPSYSGDHCYE